MRKTELLSPAKDKATAIAAIDCGADAVYIGATSFGARRNAPNSIQDIEEVVNYAHKFWAKVFVTVNTILTDSELDDAVKLVQTLDKIGVDAVIVQDMGLIKRLKEENIEIPIHISTQCDNRNTEKITFFNKLGVSRVVLARELSIDKIKEIHKTNPNLELEAFVHGALCVSYSGQCYLSQYIGGRSANRGECAQPCRKKYTVETKDGKVLEQNIHALCLKDFNASKMLTEMIDAGVYSFKIEGRLKDINYVKNITAYYAQLLPNKASSGRSLYPFVPNPEKSFNRGFTDYFLEKRKDCFNFLSPKSQGEYIGKIKEIKNGAFKINTDKKIHPQDGLTNGIDGILVNKIENGYIYPNRRIELKIGEKIFRNVDSEFEKLLNLPVKRQIGVNITITDSFIELTDEDNVCIKIELIETETANNQEKMKETFIRQFSKTGESDFYIQNINISSELPFMPVSQINELRRISFEKLMTKRISEYKRERQKPIHYVDFYRKELDYRGNVHNKEAKSFYENCNSKVLEPSLETKLPNRQIELMRTKHCIKYSLNMCKSKEELQLRDEYNNIYPLMFDCKNCEMCVLSPI